MNNTDNLQEGDIVRLRSGSPRMTIESIQFGDAMCNWFNEEGFQEKKFSITVLMKAEEETKFDL